MAPLGRLRVARLAGLALLLACCACAALHEWFSGPRRFAFSHERHVSLEKLECANCHADALAADAPGMPARDTCDVCHVEIDAQRAPEQRIDTLFQGADFVALHAAKLPAEVRFSHKLHAAGQQACNACHRGIEHNGDARSLARVQMDDCTRCHAEHTQYRGEDCALCHREVATGWVPPNHKSNWTRAHGLVARAKSALSEERCALCHEPVSCEKCHRAQAPENHTPYWRQRAHGLVAMDDRQNCAACHEPESCESCHATTRPSNHVGSWGGTLATHCFSCHKPLRSQGCAACHQGTPSHRTAAHQPPGHFPGMNCRQCHGLTPAAPLPHVDNGDDCSSCHP
jgi:hypothetical protein